MTATILTRARYTLRKLKRNADGMAAVEFAMIVPIMFSMFVGSIEFSQAITVDRRVTQAASATADLISRAPSEGVSTAQIDRDLTIVGQLMAPYDAAALTVNIISIKAVPVPGNPNALNYVVDWSRDNRGGTPLPAWRSGALRHAGRPARGG